MALADETADNDLKSLRDTSDASSTVVPPMSYHKEKTTAHIDRHKANRS